MDAKDKFKLFFLRGISYAKENKESFKEYKKRMLYIIGKDINMFTNYLRDNYLITYTQSIDDYLKETYQDMRMKEILNKL